MKYLPSLLWFDEVVIGMSLELPCHMEVDELLDGVKGVGILAFQCLVVPHTLILDQLVRQVVDRVISARP